MLRLRLPMLLWQEVNSIPVGLFLEPVTPREGLFDSSSNFKTTKAIDLELWSKVDDFKKFQFDLLLEIFILSFISYDVIKFKTVENNGIFDKFIF